ncbi:MAG TPA: hypothetical protein VHU15_14395 [Stellaceae bacterium]|jgi:hypothetical protein|nr:hypothetical protein [Stellaceae bacterium]
MSQNDYDTAIAEFLRRKAITRCPTVCAVPTHASVTEADRLALRDHDAAREAARLAKSRNYQQLLAGSPTGIAA